MERLGLNCNVGAVDRAVRVLLGLPSMTSYLYLRHFSMPWAYTMLTVGALFLLSAAIRWCPMHRILGTSTLKETAL